MITRTILQEARKTHYFDYTHTSVLFFVFTPVEATGHTKSDQETHKDVESSGTSVFGRGVEDTAARGIRGQVPGDEEECSQHEHGHHDPRDRVFHEPQSANNKRGCTSVQVWVGGPMRMNVPTPNMNPPQTKTARTTNKMSIIGLTRTVWFSFLT